MLIKKYTSIILCSVFVLLIASLSSFNASSSKANSKKGRGEKNVYVRGAMPAQHGMQLFNQHCASCHSFRENGIGPNLAGITYEVDKEWLVAFINNAPKIIESGDERATKLFEKYKQYMPPFPMIEGKDLEGILGFIHKFSQGEKRSKNNRPEGLINPIPEKIPTAELTLIIDAKACYNLGSNLQYLGALFSHHISFQQSNCIIMFFALFG